VGKQPGPFSNAYSTARSPAARNCLHWAGWRATALAASTTPTARARSAAVAGLAGRWASTFGTISKTPIARGTVIGARTAGTLAGWWRQRGLNHQHHIARARSPAVAWLAGWRATATAAITASFWIPRPPGNPCRRGRRQYHRCHRRRSRHAAAASQLYQRGLGLCTVWNIIETEPTLLSLPDRGDGISVLSTNNPHSLGRRSSWSRR